MKKLQAFVSSTFLDLRSERQAVVQGILRAGHIPAGMELFVAGDHSQWQTIRTWIGTSDVLILLLGGRYGSLEPESGLSYTHLEYLHAESLGIPTIGIVLGEEFLSAKLRRGEQWESEQAQENYVQFRSYVMAKLCAQVSDEKDIEIEVSRSLYEAAIDPNRVGWVQANETLADSQLSSELERLRDENHSLKTRIRSLLESAPEDKAVQTALELLDKFGFYSLERQGKEWGQGPFYLLSAWLLAIGDVLVKYPHHLMMGQSFLYNTIAPQLANYGLMKRVEAEGPVFLPNQKPLKFIHYELTDLGTRVLSELQRRKIKDT